MIQTSLHAEIESALNELIWDIFTNRVCSHCSAPYLAQGARTRYGLQITPDEWNCPAEFEPDEPACIHADKWAECERLAEQIADVLEEARNA